MDIKEFQLQRERKTRHFWELAKTEFLLKLLGKYQGRFSSVLDIGCGDCYVIGRVAEKFPEVTFTGCDPALTPDMVAVIKNNLGPNAARIRIATELPAEPAADAVFMFDVLEHIEHDTDYLKSLPVPAGNGLLFLSVPSYQFLFTSHDEFLGHCRRYTRKQLIATAESAGFEALESGYFFSSLILPRLLQKVFCRQTKGLGENKKMGKLNGLFTRILYLDALTGFFLKKFNIQLPGLSCYLICRKR